jgi:hypothetical protein
MSHNPYLNEPTSFRQESIIEEKPGKIEGAAQPEKGIT